MRDTDVLELVHRWAAAEQDNDPAELDRPGVRRGGCRRRVAAVHIGALREAPTPAAGGSR